MKFTWGRLATLFLCFCIAASAFGSPYFQKKYHTVHTDAAELTPRFTVVLDAGHGGEDGGAVSASGVFEKDLNLSIAKKLEKLLTSCGISVVMTRTEDVLLYDKTVDYHGRKKALDLAARRKITEETENAIFVSIHMNAFPASQYSGLQVWYSPNNSHSKILAQSVQ